MNEHDSILDEYLKKQNPSYVPLFPEGLDFLSWFGIWENVFKGKIHFTIELDTPLAQKITYHKDGTPAIKSSIRIHYDIEDNSYKILLIDAILDFERRGRLNTAVTALKKHGWDWSDTDAIQFIVGHYFIFNEWCRYKDTGKSIIELYSIYKSYNTPIWDFSILLEYWEQVGGETLESFPVNFKSPGKADVSSEIVSRFESLESLIRNTFPIPSLAPSLSTSTESSNGSQPESSASDFEYSPDYRTCLYKGEEHKFTKNQAAIVKVLHEAGGKALHQKEILNRIGIDCRERFRLSNFFRKSKAWDNLIKSTGRGFYRLNL